jgi:hypothetical protein
VDSISQIRDDNLSNSYSIEDSLKEKDTLDDTDVHWVLLNLINRQRFVYTVKDIFNYVTKCIRCRKGDEIKRHEMYSKCEEKIDNELDVLKLLKLGRQVKLLSQVMLNQR